VTSYPFKKRDHAFFERLRTAAMICCALGIIACCVGLMVNLSAMKAEAKVFPAGYVGDRIPSREIVVANQAIEGISQEDPGVITITGHNLDTGHVVYLSGIVGMTELNGEYVEVTRLTADTFSTGVDTSGYTAYDSGGYASGGLILVPEGGSAQYISMINGSEANAPTVPVYLNYGTTEAVALPTAPSSGVPSAYDFLDPYQSGDIPGAAKYIRLNVATDEKVWLRYRVVY